ncbi:MAG TPA: HIRAN domain-containing protein [Zoogloea sp.]|uniref:HIRAN domain-containing protein n=1 Tax=Zoogloea sp. TaxID=49181 RepID=UPI002BC3C7B4|nr:HIRAN domain-containing protein [Zoogloea sp.]HMV18882.1 HIRAN domain-containing protein [Rhodocyclaceae bacterium]HMV62623.1 HIRAN domain-containing protein [Rhodocyclaceae bacterium]HMW51129.1 HIRAN domain-containing protein [Rhodocyclaceae bacterium]HMZ77311.1 HIRAN domain-containing protein [Rhodocyclaceae bacterium]HNA68929.1 HIRAN domain-containing protein [Rhodocyclaceae bacterium]
MRSRRYRARVAGLALVLCTGSSLAQQVRILVQNSPLAGFQYYSGKILWDEMREGDPLVLVREPDNRHDTAAIRVEWRGVQLGHLPRAENAALAAEMDRGVKVEGRIGRLTKDPNPWKRLRVEVYVRP